MVKLIRLIKLLFIVFIGFIIGRKTPFSSYEESIGTVTIADSGASKYSVLNKENILTEVEASVQPLPKTGSIVILAKPNSIF